MTTRPTRADYVAKLLSVEEGIVSENDMDFFNFLLIKQELVYLYSQMESKAAEILQRTSKPNEQLESNAAFLKRLSLLLTKLRHINDEYSNELHNKDRQIEYLRSKLPKIDLSNTKLIYENGSIRMVDKYIDTLIKDFVK